MSGKLILWGDVRESVAGSERMIIAVSRLENVMERAIEICGGYGKGEKGRKR